VRTDTEKQEPEQTLSWAHTVENTSSSACPFCSKSFGLLEQLQGHWCSRKLEPPVQVIREKRYRCTFCNKSFTSATALKRHSFVHTGNRPFICPVCTKSFVRADRLKRHLQVHAKKDPLYGVM
jgi:KRAB domain-containing zinc finger protein